MSKICSKCSKLVYPLEELKCLDKIWHKNCFKCQECNMLLNMKNYKGYDKTPYCSAHYPKAKATAVCETPEMTRVTQNTKIQSQIKYHEEFEKKIKGSVIQVANDPETLRAVKVNTMVSQLEYKKDNNSRRQSLPHTENETHFATRYVDSEADNTHPVNSRPTSNSTHYTSVGRSNIAPRVMRIGSIADYDPVNEKYGSLGHGYVSANSEQTSEDHQHDLPIDLNDQSTFASSHQPEKENSNRSKYPDLIPAQEINGQHIHRSSEHPDKDHLNKDSNSTKESNVKSASLLSNNVDINSVNDINHSKINEFNVEYNNNDMKVQKNSDLNLNADLLKHNELKATDIKPKQSEELDNKESADKNQVLLDSNLSENKSHYKTPTNPIPVSSNFNESINKEEGTHYIEESKNQTLENTSNSCSINDHAIATFNNEDAVKDQYITKNNGANSLLDHVSNTENGERKSDKLIEDGNEAAVKNKELNLNLLANDTDNTKELGRSGEDSVTKIIDVEEDEPITTPLPGVIFAAIYEYTAQDDDEVDFSKKKKVPTATLR